VLQSVKSGECEGVHPSEADGTTEIPVFMKNATTNFIFWGLWSHSHKLHVYYKHKYYSRSYV